MDSAPVSAQVRRAGVQGDAVFGVIGASTATTIPEGIALERGAHAVDFDASGGLALFPLDAFLGPDSDVVVRDYDRTPAGRALLIVLFETLVLEGETYTSTNGTANALLGLSTSDGSWALAIEPPVGGNAVLVDAAPHVSGGGLLAVSFRGDLDFDGRIVPYSGDLSDEDARDGLVVRFSESGDVLWATHLPGRTPKHLIVNATGDAYVVAEDGTTDVAMHFDPDGGEVIWERSLGFSAKAVAHPDGVVIRGRDAAGMLGCDALSESLVLVDNRGEVVFAATSPSEVDFEPFTLFRAMGDGRFVAMTTVNDGTVIDGTTVTAEGRDIAVITYSYLE